MHPPRFGSDPQIDALPVHTIADVLRLASSVDIRARGERGVQTDFAVRGANFGQMLVLIDGVRLNDAQSGHHNGDIPVPLDAVERIEVLYGPGSSLFGADAFGGTVNTRYCVAAFCDDDGFDTDMGYRGKNQFWMVIQERGAKDNGAELNGEINGATTGTNQPIGNFEVYNAASAGIAVGILCLPIVSSLAEDALQAVPRSLRDAAYGLGGTRFDVSMKVVVPAALSGIISSFLLAIARAVGETMILAVAAGMLEAAADDLTIEDGKIFVKGAPAKSVPLGDVAAAAAGKPGLPLPGGISPGLEATDYFTVKGTAFSSGTNLAVVEVDPDTGEVKVLRYVVVRRQRHRHLPRAPAAQLRQQTHRPARGRLRLVRDVVPGAPELLFKRYANGSSFGQAVKHFFTDFRIRKIEGESYISAIFVGRLPRKNIAGVNGLTGSFSAKIEAGVQYLVLILFGSVHGRIVVTGLNIYPSTQNVFVKGQGFFAVPFKMQIRDKSDGICTHGIL